MIINRFPPVAAALLSLAMVAAIGAGSASAAARGPAVITESGEPAGFTALCAKGLTDARRELGVRGKLFALAPSQNYQTVLQAAARAGYDPIVTCSSTVANGVPLLAARYPRTLFATLGVSQAESRLKNVIGLTFADWEGGYLAGVAAAAASTVGAIGVIEREDIDPADVRFGYGYLAGAKATRRDIRLLVGKTPTGEYDVVCRGIADDQIKHGADVVFADAGACGLGALASARAHAIWGIGIDLDRASLGPFILASAVRRSDVAIATVIQARRNGTLVPGAIPAGRNLQFDVANGGVEFGRVSARAPHRAALVARLNAARKQLASGAIKAPAE